ncbi:hypothetical protein DY000_02012128 [Brassica cretica]|uniref:Uncharacterized protein n=1 Tax=Brassica cretica TaxID=69181 RepID=A0ABQ7D4A9_BRACR|nr:hypothetical protein DY000_02012128 [Brassica cretica]
MVALGLIIASRSGYRYFSMSSRVLLLRFWSGLGLGFRLSDDVTSFVLVDGLSWVHECPCVRTFDPLRRFTLLEFQGLPCASVMLRVVILDVSVVSLALRFNSSHKLLLWKGSCVFRAFSFGFVSLSLFADNAFDPLFVVFAFIRSFYLCLTCLDFLSSGCSYFELAGFTSGRILIMSGFTSGRMLILASFGL